MELQQTEPMTKYNSYSLSSRRNSEIFSAMQPNRRKIIIIAVVALVVGIALFVGGYYSGAKTATRADEIDASERANAEEPHIEWDGVCPKKTLSCPESYEGIPPLLLISLDGFRPEYLERGYTPALSNISQCSSRTPSYMYPVFPSKTLPNHYSIVTGLFPEFHGIVGNQMYDSDRDEIFSPKAPSYLNPYWWTGEPIWVTAQNQGKRSACFYWIGSEAEINGVRPNDFMKYDQNYSFSKRVDVVLEWLDRPKETRPNFLTLYFHQPDLTGHRFGVYSSQVNDELVNVDKMIAKLFAGLQQRNLLNCVNIIIVSDHGMTDGTCSEFIKLQNYINISEVKSILGNYGQLWPKDEKNDEETLISSLQCKKEQMRVYEKKQLPVRYHYSKNKRIGPIFLDLDAGWTIIDQNLSDKCSGGVHGYDNFFPTMKALFMTHGPSFKTNDIVKPFLNVELYGLMAELLNITANPNNGTNGSLHHILKKHELLPALVEPILPAIGTVPSDKTQFELQVQAANCTCTDGDALISQIDVANLTSLHGRHLPFGVPRTVELNHSHLLLYNNDYVSAYDPNYRMPIWSSFTISGKINMTEIKPCWRGDARIPSKETSACSDYNITSVSSQGILQQPLFPLSFATAGNVHEASLVTNSVPKHEKNVAIFERNFDWLISSWLRLKGSLNIIAGPAFDMLGTAVFPGTKVIMETDNKYGPLVVPTHYFYVITWCTSTTNDNAIQNCNSSDLDAVAFLLPNTLVAYNCELPEEIIKKHVALIVDVENLSGLSFFTKLPAYEAIRLRTTVPEI